MYADEVMRNGSVPTDTVLPHIICKNVVDALAWMTRTFGFTEHYRYGEPVSGAQMYLGSAYIMLKRDRSGNAGARPSNAVSYSICRRC